MQECVCELQYTSSVKDTWFNRALKYMASWHKPIKSGWDIKHHNYFAYMINLSK